MSVEKSIKCAQKHLEWENPDQAIAELRPILGKIKKQEDFAWLPDHMMGIALSIKGNHKASAKHLEEALRKGSSEPETYHMLSINYFRLGEFHKAEKFGETAVSKSDGFLKALLHLAKVYRSQAKLDEALECYQKINKIEFFIRSYLFKK